MGWLEHDATAEVETELFVQSARTKTVLAPITTLYLVSNADMNISLMMIFVTLPYGNVSLLEAICGQAQFSSTLTLSE